MGCTLSTYTTARKGSVRAVALLGAVAATGLLGSGVAAAAPDAYGDVINPLTDGFNAGATGQSNSPAQAPSANAGTGSATDNSSGTSGPSVLPGVSQESSSSPAMPVAPVPEGSTGLPGVSTDTNPSSPAQVAPPSTVNPGSPSISVPDVTVTPGAGTSGTGAQVSPGATGVGTGGTSTNAAPQRVLPGLPVTGVDLDSALGWVLTFTLAGGAALAAGVAGSVVVSRRRKRPEVLTPLSLPAGLSFDEGAVVEGQVLSVADVELNSRGKVLVGV